MVKMTETAETRQSSFFSPYLENGCRTEAHEMKNCHKIVIRKAVWRKQGSCWVILAVQLKWINFGLCQSGTESKIWG
jgi:hypothetical protein